MRLLRVGMYPIVLTATLAAGCFPATSVKVPAIRGRVVDYASEPIAGATVQLTPVGADAPVSSATSDESGRFQTHEQSSLFIYIVPTDFAPFPQYRVTVSAGGRTVPTTQVSGGVRMFGSGIPKSGQDLGDLRVP